MRPSVQFHVSIREPCNSFRLAAGDRFQGNTVLYAVNKERQDASRRGRKLELRYSRECTRDASSQRKKRSRYRSFLSRVTSLADRYDGFSPRVKRGTEDTGCCERTRVRPTLNEFIRRKIYNPGSDNYRDSRRSNLIIRGNFVSFTSALEILAGGVLVLASVAG